MTVRVRFAPSPTGYLHMGGARTALFNWLFARHHGGRFLLRIEDTDRQRSTRESIDAILDGLRWLGIESDEPPMLQSEQVDAHREAAYRLLEQGHAYRDYTTPEALEALREAARARGEKPRYAREQAAPFPDAPYAIRFKMPTGGATTLDDLLRGEITVGHEELDDLVILRSDGTPTYNFVVVCDDAAMGITHVLRGDDHLTNTFRQVPIYRALGHEPPRFGHLPLIKGLSKRLGSASIQAYRDQGFLAEAVVNYIARLGWAYRDEEIFERDALVEKFDLDGVTKAPAAFDGDKMLWVNETWLKRLPARTLGERLLPFLAAHGIETSVDSRLLHLVEILRERSKTLVDMAEAARFAYQRPSNYDEAAVTKWLKGDALTLVAALANDLDALDEFTVPRIEALVRSLAEARGVGLGKVAQPLRICLTGTSVSPPIGDTIAAVGQQEAVARLRLAPLIAGTP
jgi:glutamyl-tRNA synthetase